MFTLLDFSRQESKISKKMSLDFMQNFFIRRWRVFIAQSASSPLIIWYYQETLWSIKHNFFLVNSDLFFDHVLRWKFFSHVKFVLAHDGWLKMLSGLNDEKKLANMFVVKKPLKNPSICRISKSCIAGYFKSVLALNAGKKLYVFSLLKLTVSEIHSQNN